MSISLSRTELVQLSEVMDEIHASDVLIENIDSENWPDLWRVSFSLATADGRETMFALQCEGEFAEIIAEVRATDDETWKEIFFSGVLKNASDAARKAGE